MYAFMNEILRHEMMQASQNLKQAWKIKKKNKMENIV